MREREKHVRAWLGACSTLEPGGLELHGSTYTKVFCNKYVLHDLRLANLWMWKHRDGGANSKVICQLSTVWRVSTLNPCIVQESTPGLPWWHSG